MANPDEEGLRLSGLLLDDDLDLYLAIDAAIVESTAEAQSQSAGVPNEPEPVKLHRPLRTQS